MARYAATSLRLNAGVISCRPELRSKLDRSSGGAGPGVLGGGNKLPLAGSDIPNGAMDDITPCTSAAWEAQPLSGRAVVCVTDGGEYKRLI